MYSLEFGDFNEPVVLSTGTNELSWIDGLV
jgi:hypothetical protein